MQIAIEPMTPADWEAVRAIYLEGIATGHATFETDCPGWEAWEAARLRAGRLVARAGDRVVGWAALSPVSTRPAYDGVAEVSLCVAAAAPGGWHWWLPPVLCFNIGALMAPTRATRVRQWGT